MSDYKIYPCGCSNLIVALGKCTQYDKKGEPRADATAKQYMCRSAVLNMASQFATRSYNAHLTADKLREDDASSYVEHEAIATAWSRAIQVAPHCRAVVRAAQEHAKTRAAFAWSRAPFIRHS